MTHVHDLLGHTDQDTAQLELIVCQYLSCKLSLRFLLQTHKSHLLPVAPHVIHSFHCTVHTFHISRDNMYSIMKLLLDLPAGNIAFIVRPYHPALPAQSRLAVSYVGMLTC